MRPRGSNQCLAASAFLQVRRVVALVQRVAVLRFPVRHLPFGFVSGDAIAFLDLADHPIALAGYHLQLIIGPLAPMLPGIAFDLLPVFFDCVSSHRSLLCALLMAMRSHDLLCVRSNTRT